jgi:aspartate/methionine/tyrosine aminotransferase
MKGYFRLVYSAPIEILKEFIERIKEFFNNHKKIK